MEYNFKLCVICTGDSGAAENLAYSLITCGGVRLVICAEMRISKISDGGEQQDRFCTLLR